MIFVGVVVSLCLCSSVVVFSFTRPMIASLRGHLVFHNLVETTFCIFCILEDVSNLIERNIAESSSGKLFLDHEPHFTFHSTNSTRVVKLTSKVHSEFLHILDQFGLTFFRLTSLTTVKKKIHLPISRSLRTGY